MKGIIVILFLLCYLTDLVSSQPTLAFNSSLSACENPLYWKKCGGCPFSSCVLCASRSPIDFYCSNGENCNSILAQQPAIKIINFSPTSFVSGPGLLPSSSTLLTLQINCPIFNLGSAFTVSMVTWPSHCLCPSITTYLNCVPVDLLNLQAPQVVCQFPVATLPVAEALNLTLSTLCGAQNTTLYQNVLGKSLLIYDDLSVTSFTPSIVKIQNSVVLDIKGKRFKSGNHLSVTVAGAPCRIVNIVNDNELFCSLAGFNSTVTGNVQVIIDGVTASAPVLFSAVDTDTNSLNTIAGKSIIGSVIAAAGILTIGGVAYIATGGFTSLAGIFGTGGAVV